MNYFYLTDDAEITMHPKDPVVIPDGDNIGIVTFEIEAYPPPSFEFCYNGTCYDDRARSRSRAQVTIVDSDDETMHTAEFTVHDMNEMDNGNVTLRVTQTKRDIDFNSTVMLFYPCKFVAIHMVMWVYCGDFRWTFNGRKCMW